LSGRRLSDACGQHIAHVYGIDGGDWDFRLLEG
jgi:hypothetical protein